MTNYSFKDLAAQFNHPLAGPFTIQGQIGAGQITVDNSTEHTAQDVSADANVMVSIIAGDNGTLSIEVQQTSIFHIYLLRWWNLINAAMQDQDVSNAANMTCTLRNVVDGTSHRCQGISPGKIPAKPYAAQGQKITWVLPCADVQNLTA